METIIYEVRESVAEIALARAPANALDEPTLQKLLDALRRAAIDPEVRVVLLHSAIANRFCAGLDLKVLRDYGAQQLRGVLQKLYVDLFDVQFNLGKPSIAAVSGATRGGGMTVAVACDLVVASTAATFGYPEIDSGLLPAIHYVHLPRIVGRQRAFDLLFTGRTISAQDALELGLINRVVEEGHVLDAARQLAQTLASKPAETVRRGRAAFMSVIDQNYRRDIAAAVEQFCNVAAGEEARAGLAAFSGRRDPDRVRDSQAGSNELNA
ncbi:enoyl-CoA hydratase/isomerase family protein [Paraburkholderia fungorum]|uniref:enoyl-CoA hydratase/isomerase family protein n=1 Tax=Paraburkholderia fungorum TaxID=134537 RepID=UPI0038B76D21